MRVYDPKTVCLRPETPRALPPSRIATAERSVPLVAHGGSRVARDLSSVPVFSRTPAGLRSKLDVHQAGDAFEVEADHVADRVADDLINEVADDRANGGYIGDEVTRASAHESRSEIAPKVAPSIVHDALRQSGNPLEPPTRRLMEARIGHDFSRVRVHTDSAAAQSATALRARAFTVGRDVLFAAGQYAPDTNAGKNLLAHELAHVVQQRTGAPAVQCKHDKHKKSTQESNRKDTGKPFSSLSSLLSSSLASLFSAIFGKNTIAAGGPLSEATSEALNEALNGISDASLRRWVAYADEVKVGGSRSWRDNNPGNLFSAPTKIATDHLAGSQNAIFASMSDGRDAQRRLYLNTYGKQTVRKAIYQLTPPSENDTVAYLKALKKAGIKLDETMESQVEAVMKAVEVNEGMIEGTVVPRVATPPPGPPAPASSENPTK